MRCVASNLPVRGRDSSQRSGPRLDGVKASDGGFCHHLFTVPKTHHDRTPACRKTVRKEPIVVLKSNFIPRRSIISSLQDCLSSTRRTRPTSFVKAAMHFTSDPSKCGDISRHKRVVLRGRHIQTSIPATLAPILILTLTSITSQCTNDSGFNVIHRGSWGGHLDFNC